MLRRDPVVEPAEVARDRVPVVGDVRAPVEAAVEIDEVPEVLRVLERCVGVAVDADHLGRDPLADLGLVERARGGARARRGCGGR